MKQFYLFSVIISIGCIAMFYPMQNQAQQVIATSGGHYQGENISLSWTVGEPVIETFTGENVILTQGFQQPYNFYLQQILNIPAGWSGVSSYLDPLNGGVENIFTGLENDLIILASMDGIYYPAQGVNTLGTWDYLTGYQVKAANDFETAITGSRLENPEVLLSDGWSTLPVLSSCNVDVEDLFSGFTGLQIVKQVAGPDLYWPVYGINTLENLLPGKAYYVSVEEAGPVVFPECTKTSPSGQPHQKPENNTPWNNLSYSASSHVVAFPATVFENSGIQPGDVIGAFTMDGICAGRLEIKNTKSNLGLTLFADDAHTPGKDGFEAAEPIQFKIYRQETDEVFGLDVTFDPGLPHTGYFAGNGISAVSSLKVEATGISEIPAVSMEVYPNPSNGMFNLRINKKLSHPHIQITDYRSSQVKSISPERVNIGEPIRINLTGFSKGVYFLKLFDDGFVGMEKVVVE